MGGPRNKQLMAGRRVSMYMHSSQRLRLFGSRASLFLFSFDRTKTKSAASGLRRHLVKKVPVNGMAGLSERASERECKGRAAPRIVCETDAGCANFCDRFSSFGRPIASVWRASMDSGIRAARRFERKGNGGGNLEVGLFAWSRRADCCGAFFWLVDWPPGATHPPLPSNRTRKRHRFQR